VEVFELALQCGAKRLDAAADGPAMRVSWLLNGPTPGRSGGGIGFEPAVGIAAGRVRSNQLDRGIAQPARGAVPNHGIFWP